MVLKLVVSRRLLSFTDPFAVYFSLTLFSQNLTFSQNKLILELALERAAATFDVLGAESMGQIGYVLAQAMQSAGCTAVPILTQVVVDQYSEAFKDPTKFVGPIYGSIEAQALAQSLG